MESENNNKENNSFVSNINSQLHLHSILNDTEESQLVFSLLETIQCILTPFCPKWPVRKEESLLPKDIQQRLCDFVKYEISILNVSLLLCLTFIL